MAVNTYAVLRTNVSVMDIAKLINSNGWAEVKSIDFTSFNDMYEIFLYAKHTEEEKKLPIMQRPPRQYATLVVFENNHCKSDYPNLDVDAVTTFLTGVDETGFRRDLLTKIAKNYGGWILDETIDMKNFVDVTTGEKVER